MTGSNPNTRTTDEIDENLRRVFRQMEETGLPDRFSSLLQQLRARDGAPRDGSEDSN
jgi:hypothetical protein